jgi:hypothetical protein
MHERGSTPELRSCIIDLQNLLDELPSGMRVGFNVQEDFEMAFKASSCSDVKVASIMG